jgi:RHS repeat-associated protein
VRSGNISQTGLNYTGQRLDGTGLLYYRARYYDPKLARFVSTDSIVPGAVSGAGGGAATLGLDSSSQLTPLTVDFHEPGFVTTLSGENAFRQDKGFWFQLSDFVWPC